MSESPSANPVLVVGGGIGGLTTALALSRKGIPVRVLQTLTLQVKVPKTVGLQPVRARLRNRR